MDQYVIEYSGIVGGTSYGFETFEGELLTSAKACAKEILEHVDGQFVQQIRVTKFNIDEDTCRDLTEDVTDVCAELFEFTFDDDGEGIYCDNAPDFLRAHGQLAATGEYNEGYSR